MSIARHCPWFVFAALAACTGGSVAPVEVVITSLSPTPGAFAVSRRVQVRTAFDRDLDPASCTAANCYIEVPGNGRVAADIAYEPATRVLTLTPKPALEPLTTYRMQLTKNLRTRGGSPFASATQWDFTTDDAPVWDHPRTIATGDLLASRPSRRGGALAVWSAPDHTLQFAWSDGTVWAPTWLGLNQIVEAEVADDAAGNIVVVARNDIGVVWTIRRAPDELFQAPVLVDTNVTELLDFDLDGNRMLLATRNAIGVWLRPWVFGLGWVATYPLPNTLPRVHVDSNGLGTAVCGFHRFLPFVESTTWCERYCVDLGGSLQLCDPHPATPNAFVRASRAVFGDEGRIVATQTVDTTTSVEYATLTRVFEYTPAGGWQQLPVSLVEEPAGHAIAVGPGTSTALATIAEGLRPIVWTRLEGQLPVFLLGSENEPAPPAPSIAVAIDDRVATGALWTAKTADQADAPVRLLGSCKLPARGWDEPAVVDGPFAADAAPVQQLRAFAIGQQRALAVWTRDGVIRSAMMH